MMKKMKIKFIGVMVSMTFIGAGMAQAVSLNGAGATFPYPIYSKWFYEYNKKVGVQINSCGSVLA